MKRILVAVVVMLLLSAGALAQVAQDRGKFPDRIRNNGAEVRLTFEGAININPATGKPVTVGGALTLSGMSAPAVSAQGTGRIYFDSSAGKFKVSENGGSYANLVSGGLSGLTTGQHVVATSATTVSTDGVKRYVALLSQSGTDAPTAIVLENSLGGAIVWAREGVGEYTGTLVGAFPAGKTVLLSQSGGDYNLIDAGFVNYIYWLSQDEIEIIVRNGEGANSDNELKSAAIEIRVYP